MQFETFQSISFALFLSLSMYFIVFIIRMFFRK